MSSTGQKLQKQGAQGAPTRALQCFFWAADRGNVAEVLRLARTPPPDGVDINAVGGAGVHCTHLLGTHISRRQHTSRELESFDFASLLAAGADVAAASKTYPTPLDLMLFDNGLDWLQWNGNASIIVKLIRQLAAAGCPVDTQLPVRCGADPSLQPSTLETWLARLAEHGWPTSTADVRRALQVSRALLKSAAAQGSQGRPELLAAAAAVGSPELVAAVQKVLPVVAAPPDDATSAMPKDKPMAGSKRRRGRSGSMPKAAAFISNQLVTRPPPAALCYLQLARGSLARAKARLRAQPTLQFTSSPARLGFTVRF